VEVVGSCRVVMGSRGMKASRYQVQSSYIQINEMKGTRK